MIPLQKERVFWASTCLILLILLLFFALRNAAYSSSAQAYYQQALKKRESVKGLQAKVEPERVYHLQTLLQAFQNTISALSFKPEDPEIEALHFSLVQEILGLCKEKEDQNLAISAIQSTMGLKSITVEQKKELQESHQLRNEKQTQHAQARLAFWKQKYLQGELDPFLEQSVLFELYELAEEPLQTDLLVLLQEGRNYFLLEEQHRKIPQERWYRMLVEVLGRKKSKHATPLFLEALQGMFRKVSAIPQNQRSARDIDYMVALTNALAYSSAQGVATELTQIREHLGESGLYWKRTIPAYREILAQTQMLPSNQQTFEGYYQRALEHQSQKHYVEAIQDFTHAIYQNPQSASAYVGRGRARKEQQDLNGAIGDYLEAIRLEPTALAEYSQTLGELLLLRAMQHVEEKAYTEAKQDLERFQRYTSLEHPYHQKAQWLFQKVEQELAALK
jgi:tetratricopeptide (TPR) repeat protein